MKEADSLYKAFEQINRDFSVYEKAWQQQRSSAAKFRQQLNEQLSILNRINFSIQVPDIYMAIPKIDPASLIKAMDISEKISRAAKSITWQDTYTKEIQEYIRGVDTLVKQLSIDFSAYSLALESISASRIFADLIRLVQFNKDATEAFKAAGWPIAPSMPRKLRERVVELYQQGNTRYVSRVIMGYYQRDDHKNLIAMVDSWREHPLFIHRMHIIDDALGAHCDGKYTLSVPALLPQIEGILNEYVRMNNLPARFGKIQQVYRAAIGDLESYGLSSWAIAKALLFQLQTNTYIFTDFESELKKSVNNRQTTRHTVLHGVTINYHRPIHSFKTFVLLDALSALRQIENHGDG